MKPPRTATIAALCALAAAGCGFGAGEDAGEVELTVTRNYGTEPLIEETEPISEDDTVMRVLDGGADIETRYGGGFVQSIDGLSGGSSEGRRSDWFFFVNGIESPIGAAEFDVADGDRVWWDHRDWTDAMRVPAVVGSWPEPFVHGFQEKRWQTWVFCLAVGTICDEVADRLSGVGVHWAGLSGVGPGVGFQSMEASEVTGAVKEDRANRLNLLVGPWNQIRSLPFGELLDEGPAQSGVFATFTGPGPVLLNLLNERGEPAGSLGRGAGLVAAVRPDEGAPVWIVTGTDMAGVEAAAAQFGDSLRNRYAVAVDEGGPIGVPVP